MDDRFVISESAQLDARETSDAEITYVETRMRQGELIDHAWMMLHYARASGIQVDKAMELVQRDLDEIKALGDTCDAVLQAPFAIKH
ncbi:MAG: hypothetical protein AAF662_06480 [Pseudomonadota bacterium]